MLQMTGKRKLVTTIVVIVALILVVVTIAIANSIANKNDPYLQSKTEETSDTTKDAAEESTDTTDSENSSSIAETTSEPKSTIDPETLTTVNIEPMSLTVSYVKGVGGFEYSVMRRPNGTQYVEFYSSELAGTKCTGDQGAFASILEAPSSDEASTLSKKTTIGTTTYGLSLSATSCTGNPDLLAQYQKSFSDAFTLLKKM